jgi:hypothetical protein
MLFELLVKFKDGRFPFPEGVKPVSVAALATAVHA